MSGPHPLNPPANVEKPNWEQPVGDDRHPVPAHPSVFGNLLQPDTYFYHVLDSQPPGTLDTSLIASDNINNANSRKCDLGTRCAARSSGHVRSIARRGVRTKTTGIVTARTPWNAPAMRRPATPVLSYDGENAYANPRPVPRVLIDGSDSVGGWMALARVVSEHRHLPPALGDASQPAVRLQISASRSSWPTPEQARCIGARRNSLIDDLAKYLVKASRPMQLRDAPGGTAHVRGSRRTVGAAIRI